MTDYQTLQRRHNRIVGLFVLLALAAFVWMLLKFRNLPLFATQFRSFMIFAYFPEAPGIHRDTPVQYCGYQVGRVMDVDPPTKTVDGQSRPYHAVRARIAIEKQFSDIPDHAEVMIVRRGLGSSYIELKVAPDRPIEDHLKAGSVIYGTVGVASEFFPPEVQKKLENLVDSITILSNNTNAIIGDKENQMHIKKTLENVTFATSQAVDTLRSIQRFAETGTERLDASSVALNETLAGFRDLSQAGMDRLNDAATHLNETLASFRHLSDIGAEHVDTVALSLDDAIKEFRHVLSKLHTGPGSAAKLLNDGRLYENLLDSSRELEMALDQIKKWAAEAREKGIRIKW